MIAVLGKPDGERLFGGCSAYLVSINRSVVLTGNLFAGAFAHACVVRRANEPCVVLKLGQKCR
ncbi:hypothetical protein [Rhizobium hidalgonense]|uniref:hypothetical protein n=1 Tax=Rhizobium hidalgonense TaxID=1538159 RepID=UPI002870BE30|nr:hypothetical protein [Rhizobium hidalgonense]MDR9805583.1 hypothetical protein [Rhizobium hidalgonense]